MKRKKEIEKDIKFTKDIIKLEKKYVTLLKKSITKGGVAKLKVSRNKEIKNLGNDAYNFDKKEIVIYTKLIERDKKELKELKEKK